MENSFTPSCTKMRGIYTFFSKLIKIPEKKIRQPKYYKAYRKRDRERVDGNLITSKLHV